MVVLPVPGGPQSTTDESRSDSMSTRSDLPGPSRCCWPTTSSSDRGRSRAASGARLASRSSTAAANRSGPDATRHASTLRRQHPQSDWCDSGRSCGRSNAPSDGAVRQRVCDVSDDLAGPDVASVNTSGRQPAADQRGQTIVVVRDRARAGVNGEAVVLGEDLLIRPREVEHVRSAIRLAPGAAGPAPAARRLGSPAGHGARTRSRRDRTTRRVARAGRLIDCRADGPDRSRAGRRSAEVVERSRRRGAARRRAPDRVGTAKAASCSHRASARSSCTGYPSASITSASGRIVVR